MSTSYVSLHDASYQCILNVFQEHKVLAELRIATKTNFPERAHIQISVDQGQFLQQLIALSKAQDILEIGTFTGYSALAMALALPEHGRLIACEINKDYIEFAKHYWQLSGVIDKINPIISPADVTLESLVLKKETFDVIFIDANENQYVDYMSHALKLSTSGTVIIVDNVLALNGDVHTDVDSIRAKTMLKFNDHIASLDSVSVSILPVGGGMALCYVT